MIKKTNIDLSISPKRKTPLTMGVELSSYDRNFHEFEISLLEKKLKESDAVNILTVFESSKKTSESTAKIRDGSAFFSFNTALIDRDEEVTNYVYLKSGDSQAEIGAFKLDVKLSKIDKGAKVVTKVYSESYESLIQNFEKELRDYLLKLEDIDQEEGIRQDEEAVRKLAEADRVSSEDTRKTAESVRVANESARKKDETERTESEEVRELAELERITNEEVREQAENERESKEEVRILSEAERLTSETNRINAEDKRLTNETDRIDNEDERSGNEEVRTNAESQRELNENERISSEQARELNENERISSEQARELNENERINLHNLVQQKLENGEFVGEKGDTGDGLEYVWNDTQLGVRKEGDTEYVYVDLKGEKGDTGEMENFDSSHILDALGYMPISEADVPEPTWANLQNKPTEFNPTSHTHDWEEVTDKPSTFTPSTHTHSIDDVTGLRAELDSVPELTKENVGLGNVDNVKQASKDEFDGHNNDATRHITDVERTKWNAVDNKVDKVTGKGLSENDYTTTEKDKLAGIEAGANKYTHPGSGTNPHGTTKSDIGLGNVDNVKQASKEEFDQLVTDFSAHGADDSNPHSVTSAQINRVGSNAFGENDTLSEYPLGITMFHVSDWDIIGSTGNGLRHAVVEVERSISPSWGIQRVTEHGSTGSTSKTGNVWVRAVGSNSSGVDWGPWKRILDQDDYEQHVEDIFGDNLVDVQTEAIGSDYSSFSDYGIVFKAKQSFNLKSVRINAENSGDTVTMLLSEWYEDMEKMIESNDYITKREFSTVSGVNDYRVDIPIPADGKEYFLWIPGLAPLLNRVTSFPTLNNEYISFITGGRSQPRSGGDSGDSRQTLSTWYWFFDWKIEPSVQQVVNSVQQSVSGLRAELTKDVFGEDSIIIENEGLSDEYVNYTKYGIIFKPKRTFNLKSIMIDSDAETTIDVQLTEWYDDASKIIEDDDYILKKELSIDAGAHRYNLDFVIPNDGKTYFLWIPTSPIGASLDRPTRFTRPENPYVDFITGGRSIAGPSGDNRQMTYNWYYMYNWEIEPSVQQVATRLLTELGMVAKNSNILVSSEPPTSLSNGTIWMEV